MAIEAMLVARNPRGMARVRDSLTPGYLLRAAQQLLVVQGPIALLTGFPVENTHETDGPAGVHLLYQALERAGRHPEVWLDETMQPGLFAHLRTRPLPATEGLSTTETQPGALVVIERPGAAADGHFYNIRGQDISDRCISVEPLLARLSCPVIAIGDGGNEVGMGLAGDVLKTLPITPAVGSCDELIVADVSNWGAYAIAALIDWMTGSPTAPAHGEVAEVLDMLVTAGAVDGVTTLAEMTEDNYPASVGDSLLSEIRGILRTLEPPIIEASKLP